MELLLLRHADANTDAASDNERRLSQKGIDQALKVAHFCERHDISPSLVLSSPVRRAHETALIVSNHLKTELAIASWLACGMRPETAIEELAAFRSYDRLMIVGHEPDFSTCAAWFLGLPGNSSIHIRKASLTLLELPSLRKGTGTLEFSLPCRLM